MYIIGYQHNKYILTQIMELIWINNFTEEKQIYAYRFAEYMFKGYVYGRMKS